MLPLSFDMFLKNFKFHIGTASDETFVGHVQNNLILWDTRSQDYKGNKKSELI